MTFDVEISGSQRRVELERKGNAWRATIDGRVLDVDAVQLASGWSLLIGPLESRGNAVGSGLSRTSFEASIDERGPGDLVVHVGGSAIEARVADPRAYRRRGRGEAAAAAGWRELVAPMPGRVVKVLVKAGERVVARQGLVVVEAMKMENELRAPADAVVRDIRAREGASVEAGAVLVVLE